MTATQTPPSQTARLRSAVILLAWLLCFTPAEAFGIDRCGAEPPITHIRINIPDKFSDAPTLMSLARDLVFLEEGAPFSAEALAQSLRALNLSGRFSHAYADLQETADGLVLALELTPVPLIRSIRMRGIYPFFQRDIRNAMTIGPGDPLMPSYREEQERLVAEFFRREGFIDPSVTIETTGDPREGSLALIITVVRGPWYRLERLDFSGLSFFDENTLRRRSAVYRNSFLPGMAGRFVENRLDEDIKRMLRRCREAGFFDCSIDGDLYRDPRQGTVQALLTVAEGLRYEIELTGNLALSDGELEDEYLFVRDGNRNDVALNRSIRQMIQRYREAGYPDASIAIESDRHIEDEGIPIRSLRITVDEGCFHRIGSIRCEGAGEIDERTILGWLRRGIPELREGRPFVAEHLDKALFTLTSAYRSLGFLDATVEKDLSWTDGPDERVARIVFSIDEGPRAVVSDLSFSGLTVISEEEARESITSRRGEPLLSHNLEEDRRILTALVSERGRPHAVVREQSAISSDGTEVALEYRIDEGPSVTLGNIYFSGNFRTRERVLRRTLQMEPGEPFSPVRHLAAERDLRNLEILESGRLRAVGIAEKAPEATLLVEVAEKKPYFVEAGLGYESQRGMYADAAAGDRNLFGTNRSAWIGSEISETGYRNEASLRDPRFFGTSLSVTASFYQERLELFNQPFGTDTYGSSLAFARKLSPRVDAGLGLRLEHKKLFLREGTLSPGTEDTYRSRSIIIASPTLGYDGRDSFIRPRSGIFGRATIDISKGVRNSFDDFLKYDLDLRYFHSPLQRLTLAFLARGACLHSYGSAGIIPEDRLLFLGGISSVRGFSENMLRYDREGNPVGGRLALSGSIEARIDLGGNWEFTTFLDTGSVTRTYGEPSRGGFRSSAGVGIRYITPIGPLGVLYGAKLDRRDGEGSGRWHASIGYSF